MSDFETLWEKSFPATNGEWKASLFESSNGKVYAGIRLLAQTRKGLVHTNKSISFPVDGDDIESLRKALDKIEKAISKLEDS